MKKILPTAFHLCLHLNTQDIFEIYIYMDDTHVHMLTTQEVDIIIMITALFLMIQMAVSRAGIDTTCT